MFEEKDPRCWRAASRGEWTVAKEVTATTRQGQVRPRKQMSPKYLGRRALRDSEQGMTCAVYTDIWRSPLVESLDWIRNKRRPREPAFGSLHILGAAGQVGDRCRLTPKAG